MLHVILNITKCRPTVEKMNEFAPAHSKLFKEVSITFFMVVSTTRTYSEFVDDHCLYAIEAIRV